MTLHSPVNNLHGLIKLIVMLFRGDDLNAERRVQVNATINGLLVPYIVARKLVSMHDARQKIKTYIVAGWPYPSFLAQARSSLAQARDQTLQKAAQAPRPLDSPVIRM